MLRVRVQQAGDTSGPGLSTHYFDDADSQSAADAAASAVATFWNAVKTYRPTYGTYTLEQEVAVIDPVTGSLGGIWNVAAATGTGTDVSGQLAFATQGLARFTTNTFIDGRRLKGRIYVPGPGEGQNTNGAPIAGYVTAIAAAAAALVADASSHLAVWHRPVYEGEGAGRVRTRDGSVHQVVAGTAWNKWAILRSRRD